MSSMNVAELIESIVNKNNEKCKNLEEKIGELEVQKSLWEEKSVQHEMEKQDFLLRESEANKKCEDLENQLTSAEGVKKSLQKLVENSTKANDEKFEAQKVELMKIQKDLDAKIDENLNQAKKIEELMESLNEVEEKNQNLNEENAKRSELLQILMKENRESVEVMQENLLEMQEQEKQLKETLDTQKQQFQLTIKSHNETCRSLEEKVRNLVKENEILHLNEENSKQKIKELSQQLTEISLENQKMKDDVFNQSQMMGVLMNSNLAKHNKLSQELEKLRKEMEINEMTMTSMSVVAEETFSFAVPMAVPEKSLSVQVQPSTSTVAVVENEEATVLDRTVDEKEQSILVDTFKEDIHRQIKNFHLRIDTNDWSKKPIVLQRVAYLVAEGKMGRRIAMVCPECNKKIVISRRVQISASNTEHEVNDIRSYKRHVKTFHKFDSLDRTYFK